jgi:putative membrane protein
MDPIMLSNIVAAVVFAAIGILIFALAFVVFDRITPFTLWKEIIEEHNTALALLIGLIALSLSIIIAAAIH